MRLLVESWFFHGNPGFIIACTLHRFFYQHKYLGSTFKVDRSFDNTTLTLGQWKPHATQGQ
jgi:hypothetical protein